MFTPTKKELEDLGFTPACLEKHFILEYDNYNIFYDEKENYFILSDDKDFIFCPSSLEDFKIILKIIDIVRVYE